MNYREEAQPTSPALPCQVQKQQPLNLPKQVEGAQLPHHSRFAWLQGVNTTFLHR